MSEPNPIPSPTPTPEGSEAFLAGTPALQLVPKAGMSRAEAKATARALMKGRMGTLIAALLIVFAISMAVASLNSVVSEATSGTATTDPTFFETVVGLGFTLLTVVFSTLLQFGYRVFGEEFTYGRPLSATRVFSAFEHFASAGRVALSYTWRILAWTLPPAIVGAVLGSGAAAFILYRSAIFGGPVTEQGIEAWANNLTAVGASLDEVVVLLTAAAALLGILLLVMMPFALYANYRYFQVPYVMAHNPGMPGGEVVRRAVDMMRRRKWELFVYDLSFFWWGVLGFFTLGLSYLYVAPYINVTYGIYHRNLMEAYRPSESAISVAPAEPAIPAVSAPPSRGDQE